MLKLLQFYVKKVPMQAQVNNMELGPKFGELKGFVQLS